MSPEEGDVNGPLAPACDRPSGATFPLGTTTVTCTATDAAGNDGTSSLRVTVTCDWSGACSRSTPTAAPSSSRGAPCQSHSPTGVGAGTSTASATLTRTRTTGTVSCTVVEAVSTSSARTGNLFRYDAARRQYVHWSTDGLTTGGYRLDVDLGDGDVSSVSISLR